MKRSLFALVLSCLAACSRRPEAAAARPEVARTEVDRGGLRLSVELAPAKPSLSDEPSLTVTIDAPEGMKITKPPFGKALGTFEIRDFAEPLPEIRDGRQILRQTYRLEPTAAGEQVIAPIPVGYVDREGRAQTIESEALVVKVSSLVGSAAPRLGDLRPPAGPVPLVPGRGRGLWIAAGAALAAALAGAFFLTRRRKALAQAPDLSPTEQAYRELEALVRADYAGRGEVKTFYVELSAIVRRYIERTTRVRAPEQTTEEFLGAMKHHPAFGADAQTRLRAFLESADLVKFAAVEPGPGEIEASFQRAREFVGLAPVGETPR